MIFEASISGFLAASAIADGYTTIQFFKRDTTGYEANKIITWIFGNKRPSALQLFGIGAVVILPEVALLLLSHGAAHVALSVVLAAQTVLHSYFAYQNSSL